MDFQSSRAEPSSSEREAARITRHELTAREREVLRFIVEANSNRQTAGDLGISTRPVEVHRRRIMKKLRAKNVVDLVRIAATLDIGEMPDIDDVKLVRQ